MPTGPAYVSAQTLPQSSGPADEKLVLEEGKSRATQEPTTRREIWAWWLYMFAIEPISVVVLQLFLPCLLEYLPSMAGYLAGTDGSPCTDIESSDCILMEIGSFRVTGIVFSYGSIAVGVAFQALLFILFGALADYGSIRRRLLTIITIVGGLFCMSIVFLRNRFAILMLFGLNIVITASFGMASMLYNSYLPLLAENHPDLAQEAHQDFAEFRKKREAISNNLSTKSFMIGYSGAMLVLVLCIVYLVVTKDKSIEPLKYFVATAGAWWLVGSIFPLLNLKLRPGPKLPASANILTFSIRKTIQTVAKCRQLPNTFKFLLCYFLFADGCNSLGQVAVLFARSVLKASYDVLLICALLAPVCGIAGNVFFFKLQKWTHSASKSILIAILGCFWLLTAYCSSGIFLTSLGMHNIWEAYVFACAYGFLMGAMQSFSRVIYAELIPPGEEAEFFSLYAITDKGSSCLGPLIQAVSTGWFHEARYGIAILGLLIVLPIPVLFWSLDTERGKFDAVEYFQQVASQNRDMLELTEKDRLGEHSGPASAAR